MTKIRKLEGELDGLLEKRRGLDRQINTRWQELRVLRIAAIRGGDDPGELPFFVGLDEQWRNGQMRSEQLARENRLIDEAVARDPVLRGAAQA